jgi:hypothetical protein
LHDSLLSEKEYIMKKVLFLGIVMLLASSLGAIVCVADDVFWDLDKSPGATITDKDFKYKYGGINVRSFGDQEIYDTEKNFPDRSTLRQVYVPEEEEAPVAPIVRPETQRLPEPRRTPEPPARKTDVLPRQLDVIPQPAETTPREPSRTRIQQADKPGSTSGSTETTQPPPQPKLKWGKDAPSDEKPKFQWGK